MIKTGDELRPGDVFNGRKIVAVERTISKAIILHFADGDQKYFYDPDATFLVEDSSIEIIDVTPKQSRFISS